MKGKIPSFYVCYIIATNSISTKASFGNLPTCTQDLAGGFSLKYFAYTSFTAAKSFISFIKITVFTTFSKEVPASSKTAFKFSIDLSVAFLISSEINSPVAGSSGICPEVNNKSPIFIACEYAPNAAGAFLYL